MGGCSTAGKSERPPGALAQANPTGLTVTAAGDVWVFAYTYALLHANGNPTLALHAQGDVWQIASVGLDLQYTTITDLTMATRTRGWAIANVSAETDIGSVPVGHPVLLDDGNWHAIDEQQV